MALSGIGLSGAARVEFNNISRRLSKLSTSYSENVLDSTKARQDSRESNLSTSASAKNRQRTMLKLMPLKSSVETPAILVLVGNADQLI
eukprot:5212815-Amphidinium_carterae.1